MTITAYSGDFGRYFFGLGGVLRADSGASQRHSSAIAINPGGTSTAIQAFKAVSAMDNSGPPDLIATASRADNPKTLRIGLIIDDFISRSMQRAYPTLVLSVILSVILDAIMD